MRPSVDLPQPEFADDAERLPGLDRDRDVVHGADHLGRPEDAAADAEMLRSASNIDDRAGRGVRARGLGDVRGRRRPCVEQGNFVGAVTRSEMAGRNFLGIRQLPARFDRETAPRTKPAALGRRQQVGRRSFDRLQLGGSRPVEARDGAEQSAGIGMGRCREYLLGRSAFDDPGGVHHIDAIGVARDDPQIVGNDDHRDAEAARQILHQFQDLRLDGHVERGGRLVGDQQLRIAGEADGDHHPLTHAAGQLVRELLQPALRIGYADQRQQLDGAGLRLSLAHVHVNEQRLHHLQSDRQHRIERGHRLLEDHRDVAAADLPHRLVVEAQQIAILEQDPSLLHPRGCGRQQAHHRQRGYRLARSAFADDGHDLAGLDSIGNPLDRAHDASLGLEMYVQVVDFQDRRQLRRIAQGHRCGRFGGRG